MVKVSVSIRTLYSQGIHTYIFNTKLLIILFYLGDKFFHGIVAYVSAETWEIWLHSYMSANDMLSHFTGLRVTLA